MTNQNHPCESSAVKIAKLTFRFLNKHTSIAKLLFVRIGQAILIFSAGAAFALVYHFLKIHGLN
jgi:hypothetical protein